MAEWRNTQVVENLSINSIRQSATGGLGTFEHFVVIFFQMPVEQFNKKGYFSHSDKIVVATYRRLFVACRNKNFPFSTQKVCIYAKKIVTLRPK